jgi:hypothetical protein
MRTLIGWLSSLGESDSKILVPALVAAVVSALVSYLFKRLEQRDKLSFEYEHEQRKKLRELIGRYHGRMIAAARSYNHRMWNIYQNADKGWHKRPSHTHPSDVGYYLLSFVHRFLSLQALLRRFEVQSIVLDGRIAAPTDFVFVKYARSLEWVMADSALFAGLTYDNSMQTDHFFADNLREYCDYVLVGDDVISLDQLREKLTRSVVVEPVFSFFNGICRNEQRLRWDRMVALHLLVLAFINRFGFETDRSTDDHFATAARQTKNPIVLTNLVHGIERMGLKKEREARRILKAAALASAGTVSQNQVNGGSG